MVYVKKNKQKIKYICPNCLKDYGNHFYHYNLHINRINPCKKKNSNNENNINNDNSNDLNDNLNNENNNLIFELMKKMDLIIKQNEELKKDNEKLKNQIEIFNETPKNTTNYTLNLNFQINNYNDTKDFKGNFNHLLNSQGKQIYLKPIENLYLNPEKPENHNIYIADKSRKYAKVYNNGRWNTQNINIVDEIINNIVDYYKLSIEIIKEDNEKYEKLKTQINNKLKYVNYCDLEFLADLEDEQINDGVNNKDKIKRCIEFRKMIFDEIIYLLNDKKDIVINTHKKRKN
jgi:hypothetical protein